MPKKPPQTQNPSAADPQGRTPLHYAASEGRVNDIVDLLQSGEDPNAKDDNGWTPLHFAAQADALEAAALLLEHGAEVDAVDSHGSTPLWKAVFSYQGNEALILALREAGADPTTENKHGVSPLGLARSLDDFNVEKLFADAA